MVSRDLRESVEEPEKHEEPVDLADAGQESAAAVHE